MLGMTLLGGNFLQRMVLGRLITGIAGMIFLTVLLGVMLALLLMGAAYFLYRQLLESGMESDHALLALGGAGLILAFAISALALPHLRRLLNPPASASRLGGLGDAFIEGLMRPAENKHSDSEN